MSMYSDEDKFFKSRGLERTRHAKTPTRIIAIVALLGSIAALGFSLIRFLGVAVFFVGTVYAAEGATSPQQHKGAITLALFILVATIALVAVLMFLFSRDKDRVERAADVMKLSLGYLFGSVGGWAFGTPG